MRTPLALVVCCATSCASLVGIHDDNGDARGPSPGSGDGGGAASCTQGLSGSAAACPTQLVAGVNQSCVIGGDRNLYCWGYEIGNGSSSSANMAAYVPTMFLPKQLSTSTTPWQAGGAIGTTCSYNADQGSLCWGDNEAGQLETLNVTVPTPMPIPAGGAFPVTVGAG